ncbi:MAG: hypothetical protein AB9M53_08405 [Leptothrix sp. (in: b-proteobacteria)]
MTAALVRALVDELDAGQRRRAADALCVTVERFLSIEPLSADQDEQISAWLAQTVNALARPK